jgi:hypothetical protein
LTVPRLHQTHAVTVIYPTDNIQSDRQPTDCINIPVQQTCQPVLYSGITYPNPHDTYPPTVPQPIFLPQQPYPSQNIQPFESQFSNPPHQLHPLQTFVSASGHQITSIHPTTTSISNPNQPSLTCSQITASSGGTKRYTASLLPPSKQLSSSPTRLTRLRSKKRNFLLILSVFIIVIGF